ncbi:unnamed protein product, partial [Polarella glacialis]
MEDPYQSRSCEKPWIRERPDPVLHCDPSSSQGPLSSAQLEAYSRDGFVVLDNWFPEHELDSYCSEVAAIKSGIEASPDFGKTNSVVTSSCIFLSEPGTGALRSVFDVHLHDGVLKELSSCPKLVSIARQILADDVYIHQCRVNFQPAFVGSGFWWHSDFETWHSE